MKPITLCSIYLSPRSPPPPHTQYNFSEHDLENLINQLPRPFILLGDFNSHSKLWGCSDTNDKGVIIEDFMQKKKKKKNDLCLFNNKQSTYLHSPIRKYVSLDLGICSPNIYLDFNWSVLDDLHGSDHFPIVIKEIKSDPEKHHPRWNLNKENWENITLLCDETITSELFKTANDIEFLLQKL